MGDHLWDQREVSRLLDHERRFIRPLNYPSGAPGQGSALYELPGGGMIGVINAQGRAFMPDLDNPFIAARNEANRLREHTPVLFLDFHAEATAEKIGMGRLLDGTVSAVVGTHTQKQSPGL
jgi:calcineurin-like phosphoesterase